MKNYLKVNRKIFNKANEINYLKELNEIKEEIDMQNKVNHNSNLTEITRKLRTVGVTDVLLEIQKSTIKLQNTNYYVFQVEKKIYLYNGSNGIFYSIKSRYNTNNIMLHIYEDCLAVLETSIDEYGVENIIHSYFLIYKGKIVKHNKHFIVPIGYYRGGNDGKSYVGISIYYKGSNIKLFAHTIAALFKFGYEDMLDCIGYGSQMVVDHINNEKLDNRLCNIQLLSRRNNRWGKRNM